ncbi:uncharacterized protein [Macrobrachium rosenbergii]|uniref:uncharacterized protein n=1 Tax=Macrobrachium rosenbergii TaxID=79674 RepID=UPI0034D4D602
MLAQVRTYLGMMIQTRLSRAFQTEELILAILSQLEAFLSNRAQPVSLWKSLLCCMPSLSLLVPGSRLRMCSLQVCLRNCWDFGEENVFIVWDDSCLKDLQSWSEEHHLTIGVRLDSPLPDFHLYTDASDRGWGPTLEESQAQGLWRDLDQEESINFGELRAVEEALSCFSDQVNNNTVALFCDNVMAVSYLKKGGNKIASNKRRCTKGSSLVREPQSFSHPAILLKRWPATVDLFATRFNFRLPVYFSPLVGPMSCRMDAMLHSWDNMQVYAFPPFGLIQEVLSKLRNSINTQMTLICPFWPQRPWFPDFLDRLTEVPVFLPERKNLKQPHFHYFHRNLRMLKLAAWILSSKQPDIQDSLRQLLDNCLSV